MRAAHVSLRVEGGLRPIVRLAKFRGLLCNVAAPAPGAPARLDISGPFSLFRHTLVYGRALAELLPHLAWCARFELAAVAPPARAALAHVTMVSGDPIFPARAPAPFDSRLEERFAKDVARLAPDWDVIREPVPLQAGATLIFPDFLLRHRIHPERQALVEIVGFWTPDYLTAEARPPAPGRATRVCPVHRRGTGLRAVGATAGPAGGDVPPPRRRRRRDARGGAVERRNRRCRSREEVGMSGRAGGRTGRLASIRAVSHAAIRFSASVWPSLSLSSSASWALETAARLR